MNDYLTRDQCKEGYTYKIHSRNLRIGVYRKDAGGIPDGFTGIREKFGDLFLFTEYHCDGEAFATVRPLEEVEKCPIEDLRERLDDICGNCKTPIAYRRDMPPDFPYKKRWIHLAKSGSCREIDPWTVPNTKLFKYLDELERKLFGKPLCWRCQEGHHGRHKEVTFPKLCECDDPACRQE
jgi:hypothetical protein